MRKSLVVLALVVTMAWPAVGNALEGSRARAGIFIGLWEGVDPADGSLTQRSITCNEEGSCQVLGSDQFFSLCQDSGGRGIITGTGRVEGRALVVPDLVLTCADGSATPEFLTRYTFDRPNGTLVEDAIGGPPNIAFHRLTERPRGWR